MIIPLLVGLFLLFPNISVEAAETRYDRIFQRYGEQFFSHEIGWHWFKAQAIVESGLNRKAVSERGARGIMQLMPETSKEMAKKLGITHHPYSIRASIKMGIAYDRELYNSWPEAPRLERIRIMLAAYNAGPENIRRAMRVTSCPGQWHCIAEVLPRVTGSASRETILYVTKVERVYCDLKKAK